LFIWPALTGEKSLLNQLGYFLTDTIQLVDIPIFMT